MARRTSRSEITRRLALALVAIVLAPCSSGPRLHARTYGALGKPYLAPQVAEALDRRDDPVHRVILMGDSGAPGPKEQTLEDLRAWGDVRPDRTTVLFLGDNLYPAGLRDDDRPRGESVLRRHLEATRAAKVFLPGNHDWGFTVTDPNQTGTLRNEQRFILAHAGENADFEPRDGCPGPVAIPVVRPHDGLERGVTVIAIDFHWWLLDERVRPRCAGVDDTDAFLGRLREQLAAHREEWILVAAHHPLRSGGPHGGLTRGFAADLGAGFFYDLYGSLQDLWEPNYAQMIKVVSAVLAEQPPLAVVGGHDHSLQILEGGDAARLMVVSGAGSASEITPVTAIEGTLFAHSHPGFVVLDFFASEAPGDALLVRVVETGARRPVFSLGIELTPPGTPALPPPPGAHSSMICPGDPGRPTTPLGRDTVP